MADELKQPLNLSCNDWYYWNFGMMTDETKRRIIQKYAALEKMPLQIA